MPTPKVKVSSPGKTSPRRSGNPIRSPRMIVSGKPKKNMNSPKRQQKQMQQQIKSPAPAPPSPQPQPNAIAPPTINVNKDESPISFADLLDNMEVSQ